MSENAVGRLRILTLLGWLREYGSLFKMPDLDNSAEFRRWCIEITGLLDRLAGLTPTELDDKLAEFLQRVAADDESWDHFYAIFTAVVDLIDGEDDDENLVAGGLDSLLAARPDDAKLLAADDPRVLAMADKTGIDPATIFALIMAAVRVFKWFRERRKDG